MKIVSLRRDGSAYRSGIREGDNLLAINGHAVTDHIDYLYHSADEVLRLELEREGELITLELVRDEGEDPGIELEPLEVRGCGDDCVFCFTEQNPGGVRDSLLFRDEDYRLSFLHGNYVTLDNLRESDFERIVEMRLSPLYVSVHTTDPDLRLRMVRGRRAGELFERMQRLISGGIRLHTQIVLVPGWNDGEHLRRTVMDLAGLHPGVQSVAVVPVGLTDHREGLTELRRLTAGEMRGVIAECEEWREDFTRRFGYGFAYLADEFYLASGEALPPVGSFDDLFQVENGVGMAAAFVDSFEMRAEELAARLAGVSGRPGRPVRVAGCTGSMGMEMFRRHLLRTLGGIDGLRFDLIECINTFYGAGVTASGLLSSACFSASLEGIDLSGYDCLMLPPNCTNDDGLFLDDMGLEEFAARYPCRVEQGSYDLAADLIRLAGSPAGGGSGEG